MGSTQERQLIPAVAAANPRTIVVLNTGGPVLMPWLNQVKGVLESWYPGVQDGNAIAPLLFGDVNPSGRLPQTLPQSDASIPTSTPEQYPGIIGADGNVHASYSEGPLVGYRWYDARNVKPLFCFGDGLSYTTFGYSGLKLSAGKTGSLSVSFQVKNTGKRAGAEVAQVYVGDPMQAAEPPKHLKGDAKVSLAAGQTKQVTVVLDRLAFSYWNAARGWTVAPGSYRVMIGSSACAIRKMGSVTER